VCAGSKEIQHLEVFEGCRKECVQESFSKTQSWRKLRKDKAFEIVEGLHRKLYLEVLRRCRKFVCRWTSFTEEHLVHLCRNLRGRTDGRNSLRRIHEFP
jgi:hypothetical protein